MARAFLQHPVADFDAWRPVFDADEERRAAAGVSMVAVLRDVADANSVWLVADGERSAIEAFMQDPELGEKMQAAGVTAPPQVFFTD